MREILVVTAVAVLFAFGIGQLHTNLSRAKAGNTDESSPETVHLIDSLDGATLYKAYCAVCHGVDGRGGGPMAASLKVLPPDLTKIAAHNEGVYPEPGVERIISGEEVLPRGHGSRAMPVWGPIFSQIAWDQDLGRLRVHNLAHYIARLQAK